MSIAKNLTIYSCAHYQYFLTVTRELTTEDSFTFLLSHRPSSSICKIALVTGEVCDAF